MLAFLLAGEGYGVALRFLPNAPPIDYEQDKGMLHEWHYGTNAFNQ